MPASGWKRVLCAVAAVCVLAAGAAQDQPEDRRQIFREIDRSLQELASISGLKAKKRIRYDLITRDKVNQFLKDRVKESVKPDDLRAEEITLKKLGFVPPDFNLEKSTVDLLTEQAAAFYDYHKKKLFLTDWAPSGMQETALVHELAHALADQSFHLERFIKQGGRSDDSEMARMAVMEGQATWLMTEVQARRSNQSISGNPALLKRGMPTFFDFYQQAFGKPPSGPKHEALFLMNDISTKMQRGVFLPKGSPTEAARELRQAFHALEKDKDFVEDFKKITGDDPELVPAEEVERIFARIRNVSPVVKQVLKDSVGAEQ